jgi:hypothetical protein
MATVLRLWILRASIAVAVLGAPGVQAGTVSIGFEDGPYGPAALPYGPESGTNNFSTQGFIFSPGCHHDWLPTPAHVPDRGGHWLGFDVSGCYDSAGAIGYNKDYLGPGGPEARTGTMFVKHLWGETFTAESFVWAATGLSSGLTIRSSKGGELWLSLPYEPWDTVSLVGDEWRDISWLVFSAGGSGVPAGFDDLVLSGAAVPIPGTLGLALTACFVSGSIGRSRRK